MARFDSFFRPEASSRQWGLTSGELQASVSVGVWEWASLLGAGLAMFLAFAGTASYTRSVRASGYLAPRHDVVQIGAPDHGSQIEPVKSDARDAGVSRAPRTAPKIEKHDAASIPAPNRFVPLQAHLLVSGQAVASVRPGMPVQLRYDAFPFRRFGARTGHVAAVSLNPMSADRLRTLGVTATSSVLVYDVVVDLAHGSIRLSNGESVPLEAGMTLEAEIEIEKRRIISWMLDPLISVASRGRGTEAGDGSGP